MILIKIYHFPPLFLSLAVTTSNPSSIFFILVQHYYVFELSQHFLILSYLISSYIISFCYITSPSLYSSLSYKLISDPDYHDSPASSSELDSNSSYFF